MAIVTGIEAAIQIDQGSSFVQNFQYSVLLGGGIQQPVDITGYSAEAWVYQYPSQTQVLYANSLGTSPQGIIMLDNPNGIFQLQFYAAGTAALPTDLRNTLQYLWTMRIYTPDSPPQVIQLTYGQANITSYPPSII